MMVKYSFSRIGLMEVDLWEANCLIAPAFLTFCLPHTREMSNTAYPNSNDMRMANMAEVSVLNDVDNNIS